MINLTVLFYFSQLDDLLSKQTKKHMGRGENYNPSQHALLFANVLPASHHAVSENMVAESSHNIDAHS